MGNFSNAPRKPSHSWSSGFLSPFRNARANSVQSLEWCYWAAGKNLADTATPVPSTGVGYWRLGDESNVSLFCRYWWTARGVIRLRTLPSCMQRQHVSNCPFLKYPPAEEYDMELNAGVGFLIGMDYKLYIVVVDILSCSVSTFFGSCGIQLNVKQ